jgi:hypothetical protein
MLMLESRLRSFPSPRPFSGTEIRESKTEKAYIMPGI